MFVCRTKRRNSSSSSVGVGKRSWRSSSSSASSVSCWRNPFVVFFLTFVSIGSVRFRPRNNNINNINPSNVRGGIAQALYPSSRRYQQQLQQQLQQQQQNYTSVLDSSSSSSNWRMNLEISYKLIEEQGQQQQQVDSSKNNRIARHAGQSFQKYVAINSKTGQPISVLQWAQGLSSSTKNAVTLSTLLATCKYEAFFWETPPFVVQSSSSNAGGKDAEEETTILMEFVLVDAPELQSFARNPDYTAFAEYFYNKQDPNQDQKDPSSISPSSSTSCPSGAAGCVFESLGKDALLVVPKPSSIVDSTTSSSSSTSTSNPAHLANWVRTTPMTQQAAVWKLLGETWLNRVRTINQKRTTTTTTGTATTTGIAPGAAAAATAASRGSSYPLWLSTSGMGIAYLHFRIDTRPKYYTYQPYKQAPASVVASVQQQQQQLAAAAAASKTTASSSKSSTTTTSKTTTASGGGAAAALSQTDHAVSSGVSRPAAAGDSKITTAATTNDPKSNHPDKINNNKETSDSARNDLLRSVRST